MNKDRYLQALAAEVNASVEALLSDSTPQPPVQRLTSRQPALRTTIVRGLPHRDRTQSALFPGVSPTISRFDSDKD